MRKLATVHVLIRLSASGRGPRTLSSPRPRISVMDLLARSRRSLGTGCAQVGTSAPVCVARSRIGLGPRGALPQPLAARLPGGVSRHTRRRCCRGHRAGVVPGGDSRARPLRPAPAVRAVAAPDRRQPRDRLDARAPPSAEVELTETVAAAYAADRPATTCWRARPTPPEHRGVIVMRYLLEFTPGEIAEALGLPRGTVNSRLRRGLDALGDEL